MKRIAWRMLGVVVAVGVVASHGQAGGGYAGNRLCVACHKRTEAAIVEGYQKTAHAQAMQAVADATIVADFANAPFDRAKIAYVLCRGRHEQAYLDADLKVLPGIWSVDRKAWLPQEAVDAATECLGCHTVGFNPETRTWVEMGVGCESCHGPGKTHTTAKKEDRKSTILNSANFEPKVQAMTCGQCHSRGRDKSGKYAFPHGYVPGGDLAAAFDDAKPAEAGRNQQFSDLMQSPKHWDNGVVCEKCHDPHGDTAQPYQLRLPINETCLQCHADKIKSLAEHVAAKGKTAPENATCATCHMPEGRHLFDKTVAD